MNKQTQVDMLIADLEDILSMNSQSGRRVEMHVNSITGLKQELVKLCKVDKGVRDTVKMLAVGQASPTFKSLTQRMKPAMAG